jgi:hypothetical protein
MRDQPKVLVLQRTKLLLRTNRVLVESENGELPQPMTMSDPPGVSGAAGRITAA